MTRAADLAVLSPNVAVSGSNMQFDSGFGSVATAYGCRAWVNFNGTGTVAIRASGNVSSITDSGVGLYTVNFTTAMPDANYSINITSSSDGITIQATGINGTNAAMLTTGCAINIWTTSANVDRTAVLVSVFR